MTQKTEDLYDVGTIGTILQLLKLPDGTVKVLVEGGERVRISEMAENDGYIEAQISQMTETLEQDEETGCSGAYRSFPSFEQYVKLNKKNPPGSGLSLFIRLAIHQKCLTRLPLTWH